MILGAHHIISSCELVDSMFCSPFYDIILLISIWNYLLHPNFMLWIKFFEFMVVILTTFMRLSTFSLKTRLKLNMTFSLLMVTTIFLFLKNQSTPCQFNYKYYAISWNSKRGDKKSLQTSICSNLSILVVEAFLTLRMKPYFTN